jgi:hypothetical protein
MGHLQDNPKTHAKVYIMKNKYKFMVEMVFETDTVYPTMNFEGSGKDAENAMAFLGSPPEDVKDEDLQVKVSMEKVD